MNKEKESQKGKENNDLKKTTTKEQYEFVISQFKKIKWAKRKDVLNGTIVVCSVSLAAVLYFGTIDYVVDLVKGLI